MGSLVAGVTGRPAAARALDAPDVALADVGVTSLHFFRLVTILEDRFGIRLTDDDVDPQRFATVSDVGDLLAQYGVTLEL